MADTKEMVIGIDLGTTNSCAAIVRGGRPEVILNAEGDRITPSAVAFTEPGERLVGKLAKRQAVLNPEQTILSIKRKMGTDYRVRIALGGREQEYTPEQISAFILQKIKRDAEERLDTKIEKAVITCPAYFDNLQRQATKDAGQIAGLEVLRIISEPTAAALAYGLDKKGEQKILVYDLGGGTFDVSILDIGEALEPGEMVFQVIATDGDTQLGGDDFDRRIMDWLVEEFKKDTGIDLRDDPAAMQRLRDAADQAKIELSSLMETEILLPYITADTSGPKHLERILTRAQFIAMIDDLLLRTIQIVDQALAAAKLKPQDINQVVLVGGCTRIPRVQELVAEKFGRAKINKEVNPDEVVAVGAAIQAAILTGDKTGPTPIDATPLTLAIEILGGIATPIIERNTSIPVERTKTFTTAEDFQTQVEIHIVQGERKMAADNRSLGRFVLSGIQPAPRGVPQIEVTFSIDEDGILQVKAKDQATGQEAAITIKDTSRLTREEIEQMRDEAKKFEQTDRALVAATKVIHSVEDALRELGDKVAPEKRAKIAVTIQSLKEKLAARADLDLIQAATEELRQVAGEVTTEAYQRASSARTASGSNT